MKTYNYIILSYTRLMILFISFFSLIFLLALPFSVVGRSFISVKELMISQNIKFGILPTIAIGLNFQNNEIKLNIPILKKKHLKILKKKNDIKPFDENKNSKVKTTSKHKKISLKNWQSINENIYGKITILGEIGDVDDAMNTAITATGIQVFLQTFLSVVGKNLENNISFIPSYKQTKFNIQIKLDIKVNIFVIIFVTLKILITNKKTLDSNISTK